MRSARILIVEDDPIVARDIRRQLSRLGHTVVAVANRGEEAVRLALEATPDLVLMDVRLEGDVDGIEAVRQIHQARRIPVLYLTAYADDATLSRALATEPFGYILKPFEDLQLRTAIETALYREASERRVRESERRYAVTLASIGEAVIVADGAGAVTFLNPAAQTLTGWSHQAALGQPFGDVVILVDEETGERLGCPIESVVRLGATAVIGGPAILLRRDGLRVPIAHRGTPLIGDGGPLAGMVFVFRDTTRQRQEAEADASRRAHVRGELALPGSGVTLWDLTLADGTLDGAALTTINHWEPLGFPQTADEGGLAAAVTNWHPDDRERVARAVDDCWQGKTARIEVTSRVQRADGTYVWRLNQGGLVRDAAGQPVRLTGISVDIDARVRLERELMQAKEAAEAANRAKDEFLANVSHEIRTPMNAILGMTDLVLETRLEAGQRQSLKTVRSAAGSLLGIINDLLDFSKIEAGRLELDAGPFALRAALAETMQALAVRAHRKRLDLSCNVRPDVPDALIGDVGRLRQVLTNLIGNAIKFTAQGGVMVSVELASPLSPPDDVRLRFAIRDTGIGIAAEKQEAIFRAFEQEDTSTTRRYGGTGLGLTIASRLVALMNGDITVESVQGRGSTFTATASFGYDMQDVRLAEPELPAPLSESRRAKLRVLIAEDDEWSAQLLRQLLAQHGHKATVAGDGRQALSRVATETFDLLLLDLHMPEADGLEVARTIRAQERGKPGRLPMIALTARGRHEDRERCLAVGIDDLLVKPIVAETLWPAIDRVMPCG